MLLSREIKSCKGLSEEKTLAFQPEETAPEDRRKHSGPLRGLWQFGAKRRRNRGRPCWRVAEMTWPSGDGKGTALHLQRRGGHSNGSPAVSTSPSVRAPLPCDQNRHWKVGGRKQLDSPTGEEGSVSCRHSSNFKEDSWRRLPPGRPGSPDSRTETQKDLPSQPWLHGQLKDTDPQGLCFVKVGPRV